MVEGFSNQLQQPIAFAAVDSIVRDEQGQLKFHYVVVEVGSRAQLLAGCTVAQLTAQTVNTRVLAVTEPNAQFDSTRLKKQRDASGR